MGRITHPLTRWIAMLLVGALLTLSAPVASARPLTAETVHARIVKRGIGNWVGVELQNGTEFWGRIISVDEQTFGLQLHNDPAITPVQYSDVVGLHMGISHGAFWAITAVGIGGVIAMAIVAHHELSRQPTFPSLPTQPTQPLFP
jgi:hypothetical protein